MRRQILPPSPWALRWHKPVFASFLAAYAIAWLAALLRYDVPEAWQWSESIFIVAATATTFVGLARRLPTQNVVSLTILIVTASATLEFIAVQTGIPFGSYVFTAGFGAKLFNAVPWVIPLSWFTVIIASRGTARLILRPWRNFTHYGFWVIGLSALLVVLLDLGLEPYAVKVKHYWLWSGSGSTLNWYHAPWMNFFGLIVTTGLILLFATPWLINKQPVKQPTDYHPVILWQLLNLLFVTGSLVHHLWLAAAVGIITSASVGMAAYRGATW